MRPYHAGGNLSGPAFTVKTRPGDNLMVHKALDIASPGDVVVVDAGGDVHDSYDGSGCLAVSAWRRRRHLLPAGNHEASPGSAASYGNPFNNLYIQRSPSIV